PETWCYVVDFVGYHDSVVIPAIGCDLDLAYAVTIHKSQGSEWPLIVLPAVNTNSPFYDRGLFYTGLSRASRGAVIVGNQDGLSQVVSRTPAVKRRTFLSTMLRDAI